MMSVKVSKINKYYIRQERQFVISNVNIYNFNKKSKYLIELLTKLFHFKGLKRIIAITNLAGLTKNLQKNSKEFVIHVLNEPDLWVNSDM